MESCSTWTKKKLRPKRPAAPHGWREGLKKTVKKKMAIDILVTNDDGIYAEGIQVLSQTLFESSAGYNLFIVAPDHERSAVARHYAPAAGAGGLLMHNRELVGWSVNGTLRLCCWPWKAIRAEAAAGNFRD